MYISRVKIENYRNFKHLDVWLDKNAIIVGPNKVGKTNLLNAIRLVIDPDLPNSMRELQGSDFWDGEGKPFDGRTIEIYIELTLDDNVSTSTNEIDSGSELPAKEDNSADTEIEAKNQGESHLFAGAVLSEGIACFKYRFELKFPFNQTNATETQEATQRHQPEHYHYRLLRGKNDEECSVQYLSGRIAFKLLRALRDAEDLLSSWSSSPLNPLLTSLNIQQELLHQIAASLQNSASPLVEDNRVKELTRAINRQSLDLVGAIFSVDSVFNFTSDDAGDLLRSIRLFVDGQKMRPISRASLGTQNILYLSLLLEEMRREAASDKQEKKTILAVEEPEAHVHPHVQRSVFGYFIERDTAIRSLLVTTHSPHIVSVAPLKSIVLLRDEVGEGTQAHTVDRAWSESPAGQAEIEDLERYLDVTRGELLFSRGVIFVEGAAELYLVPAFASQMKSSLDEERCIELDQLGISVVAVHGVDFKPYVRLVSEANLNIPFAVLTDGDEQIVNNDDGIEEINERGIARGRAILRDCLQLENTDEFGPNELAEFGIFVGNSTLEIDLLPGCLDDMSDIYDGFVSRTSTRERFRQALEEASTGNTKQIGYVLERISTRIGKGRFAQRLAPRVTKAQCPRYIEDCIRYIETLVTPLGRTGTDEGEQGDSDELPF